MDDEITRLRAEADRLFAEAERLRAEAKRRWIAVTAETDQTMALVRDALARSRALTGGIVPGADIARRNTEAERRLVLRQRVPAGFRQGLRSDRAVRVTERLLTFLRGRDRLPLPTSAVIGGTCLQHEYQLALRMLNRLARLGLAEKWAAAEIRWNGYQVGKTCYWTAVTPPPEGTR